MAHLKKTAPGDTALVFGRIVKKATPGAPKP
jgi:hypothetical protein